MNFFAPPRFVPPPGDPGTMPVPIDFLRRRKGFRRPSPLAGLGSDEIIAALLADVLSRRVPPGRGVVPPMPGIIRGIGPVSPKPVPGPALPAPPSGTPIPGPVLAPQAGFLPSDIAHILSA